MPTNVVEDNGSHYISLTITGKGPIKSYVTECVQGNVGKIRHITVVWACTKIIETIREGKVTILRNQQVKTDRPRTNNNRASQSVIMKRNMYVNRCCIFRRQTYDQERSKNKVFQYEYHAIETQHMRNIRTELIRAARRTNNTTQANRSNNKLILK